MHQEPPSLPEAAKVAKAFSLSPSCDLARTLFVLYLDTDKPAGAIPYIDYAIQCGTIPRLNRLKTTTLSVMRLEQALSKDSTNTQLKQRIAQEYTQMGNTLSAARYTAAPASP